MRVGKGYKQANKSPRIRTTENSAMGMSKSDPTRTGFLRQSYGRALTARLNRLKGDIVKLINNRDIMGLRPMVSPFTTNEKYTYASTQVDIQDPDLINLIGDLQRRLPEEEVIRFESVPHITVRYGLHQLDDTAEKVARIVGTGHEITVMFGKLSVFEVVKEDEEFDVLKIEVYSPDLKELNSRLGYLPNTQTYEYNPHMTIAYMKKGTAGQWAGDMEGVTGTMMKFKMVKYSNKEGDKKEINIYPVNNLRLVGKELNDQIELFSTWITQKLEEHLIGSDEKQQWKKFTLMSYQKGVLRAYDDAYKTDMVTSYAKKELVASYQGRRVQFTSELVRQSLSLGVIETMSNRMFKDLEGVANVLKSVLYRTFVDGLISDKGSKEIAGQLIREINRVGVTRSKLVAAMDVVRTYNEAKLDAYTKLGVKEVTVDVEWSDANSRTCQVCKDLSSITLPIEEARGHLPVHVGCCCMWTVKSTPKPQSIPTPQTVVNKDHQCTDCFDSFGRALESSGIDPGTVD